KVQHDHVRPFLGVHSKRAAGILSLDTIIAMGRQTGAEEPAYLRLVVDDQDAGQLVHMALCELMVGIVKVKIAPLRSLRLPAAKVPPKASTKPRATESPRPVPATP